MPLIIGTPQLLPRPFRPFPATFRCRFPIRLFLHVHNILIATPIPRLLIPSDLRQILIKTFMTNGAES